MLKLVSFVSALTILLAVTLVFLFQKNNRSSTRTFEDVHINSKMPGCRRIDHKQAMFRGNLMRTGVFASGGPTALTELVWKFKTEGKIWMSPIIYRGVVYFNDADGNVFAVK